MTRARSRSTSRRASERGLALKQWEMHFGPNMTPMVDVVMVILIFFMAGTALIAPEMFLSAGLPSEPGETDAPGPVVNDPFELPPAQFTLRIHRASGRTVIDGLGFTSGSLDELQARLGDISSGASDFAVLIQPALDVPFADVVAIHDRIIAAGISRVGLLDSSRATP